MSRLDDLARRRLGQDEAVRREERERERRKLDSEYRQAISELPGLVRDLLKQLEVHPDPDLDLIGIRRFRRQQVRDDERLAGYSVAHEVGDMEIEYGHPGSTYYVLSDGRLANSSTVGRAVKEATNVWRPSEVAGPVAIIFVRGIRGCLGHIRGHKGLLGQ